MRVTQSRPCPGWLSLLLITVGVAATYLLGGRAGLALAEVHHQVSPIWPPTGIALFALLHFGPRAVPGIVAGALLVNWELGPSATGLLIIVVGNTLAPLVAYLLLRAVRFRPDLNRTTDAAALIGLGGLAGMTISATGGTSALLLAEAIPATEFWPTWMVWWAGDAMGVLIVAPVLLLLRSTRPSWLGSQRRWTELLLVLTAAVGVTVLVTDTAVSVMFPAFLPLLWAAMRFQQAGAAPCALITSIVATLSAADRAGPFAGHDLVTTMIILHAFNGSIALVALLLSAALNERNQAQAAIEDTCRVLADAVTRLSSQTGLGDRTLTAVRRAAAGAAVGKPDSPRAGLP